MIDGATDQTKLIPVGGFVFDLAVDPVTNKVYVANGYIGKITVIDGATQAVTATIPVGGYPGSIAVNPVTNKIYIANDGLCGGVMVIDGGTKKVTRIEAGAELAAIVVNPVTNKIYAYDPENVTVIDGATNKAKEVLLPIPAGMPRYAASCGKNAP